MKTREDLIQEMLQADSGEGFTPTRSSKAVDRFNPKEAPSHIQRYYAGALKVSQSLCLKGNNGEEIQFPNPNQDASNFLSEPLKVGTRVLYEGQAGTIVYDTTALPRREAFDMAPSSNHFPHPDTKARIYVSNARACVKLDSDKETDKPKRIHVFKLDVLKPEADVRPATSKK